MKRDFLKELGLSDEVIDKVMAENGKDINSAKGESEKLSAELEQTKSELTKANETLEKFKDYEQTKADVEKYKSELATSKAEFEQKIAKMETQGRIKEFTSTKKFVNDFTRDSINEGLEKALADESNKGKSLEELLGILTEGKENIFLSENTPNLVVQNKMTDSNNGDSGVLEAFKKLNPNLSL